jgi:hypothetical protein
MAIHEDQSQRFHIPYTTYAEVEEKLHQAERLLSICEQQAEHLTDELKHLGFTIHLNSSSEASLFEAEIDAEHLAHAGKGQAILAALGRELRQTQEVQHHLYATINETAARLKQTAEMIDSFEHTIGDLTSLLRICHDEHIIADPLIRHALNEVAIDLEQHEPLPEPMPALLDHHAGGSHKGRHSHIEIATDMLKLFGHAAEMANKNKDSVVAIMHAHSHELQHLMEVLPADIQQALHVAP